MIGIPYGIGQIRDLLAATSNDLGTLCKDDAGLINMWARFKPVRNSGNHYESQRNGSAWLSTADWWKGANEDCGISVQVYTAYNPVISAYDNQTVAWSYVRPRGVVTGSYTEPFRMSDFLCYKHDASSPMLGCNVSPREVLPGDNAVLTLQAYVSRQNTLDRPYEIVLTDLKAQISGQTFDFSNAYLGAIVTLNGVVQGVKKSEYVLSSDQYLRNVTCNMAFSAAGTYKAYPVIVGTINSAQAFVTIPGASAIEWQVTSAAKSYATCQAQLNNAGTKIEVKSWLYNKMSASNTFSQISVNIRPYSAPTQSVWAKSYSNQTLSSKETRTLTEVIDTPSGITTDNYSQYYVEITAKPSDTVAASVSQSTLNHSPRTDF